MTEIEQEFLNLFLDDGALTRLAEAAENIRNILNKKKLSSYNVERIGHCGIAGEYLHGIGFVHQLMSFHKRAPEEEPIDGMIANLIKSFNKPSQLSNSPPEIAGEHHKNENCFDAIPRAINDATEWAKAASLPPHPTSRNGYAPPRMFYAISSCSCICRKMP